MRKIREICVKLAAYGADAWMHLTACIVIASIVFKVFKGAADPFLPPAAAVLITFFIGIVKEFVDARTGGSDSVKDLVFDIIGAVIGTLICLML